MIILSKYRIFTINDHYIDFKIRNKIFSYLIELIFYPLNIIYYITYYVFVIRDKYNNNFFDAFLKLGPIYIKLGQTLSTRPDLIGIKLADRLKLLQDKIPPFDHKIAINKIEEEFNCKINDIFSEFDHKPVAAASIAQVYKAKLKEDGVYVAVKILRPNIRQIYNNDIKILKFISQILVYFFPYLKRLKLCDVVKIFEKSMINELNLRIEAAGASRIKDNFKDNPDIYIPKIYWNFISENILVLEWINGVSIYDKEKLIKHKIDLKTLSKNIAIMFFHQTYNDGFFHADLHPGNIIVQTDKHKLGAITLIDFGIIGIIPKKDRIAIAEILYAFLQRDYNMVAKIHARIGYIPKNTDLDEFTQHLRSIAEPIIGMPIKDISVGKLLARLFQTTEIFGMETQPQLILLQKTILVVEGIGRTLNDDMNMWELASPWIKKWAIKNISPEVKFIQLIKSLCEDLWYKL